MQSENDADMHDEKVDVPHREFTHCLKQSWLEQSTHTGKRKTRTNATGTIVTRAELRKEENRNKCVNWSITRFSLNPLLTEEMWKRHQLSLSDIKHIIKSADPSSLWLLALSEKFPITSSAIKPCLSSSDDLVRANKTVIMRKLIECYEERYADADELPDTMICEGDQHKPLCSLHDWNDQEMNAFAKACGGKIHPQRQYASTFSWKGIDILPYRMYKNYLQCVSVMPVDNYNALFSSPTRFRVTPHTFVVGKDTPSILYYDLPETWLVHNENGLHIWPTATTN